MTQLIRHTRENCQAQVQREATVKESLTVQTEDARPAFCHAVFNHFRGVTKMVGQRNNWGAAP